MKIAIHQPNFCPWLPFFRKIEAVDVFVILTHCQYEKGGYQNRFQHDDRWHTMSVNRGMHEISQKRYATPDADWTRITDKLPELHIFNGCISDSLAKMNIAIIRRACQLLKITTEIVLDYPTELRSTHRIVDICRHYGATEYLAGSGADAYMEPSLFGDIKVSRQEIAPEDRVSMAEALEKMQCASC